MNHSLSRLGMLFVLLLAATFCLAATPSSGTINTPADNTLGVKQTINYSGGPMAVSLVGDAIVANTALTACESPTPPPTGCDFFSLAVNLPANYTLANLDRTVITLTWTATAGDASNNDLDLYLLDANGNSVAQSTTTNAAAAGGTGVAQEQVGVMNIAPGSYQVLVVCSTCTTGVPTYNVAITFSLVQPPSPPPSTATIFQNFQPPVNADGSQLGTQAGEPSIGVNQKTGAAMYQALFQTLRVNFNDAVYPATATWQDVGPLDTNLVTLDPILYSDPHTNRTFVAQLMAACSLMAFTDDDGETWWQNPVGCGIGTAFDHETVGGGPIPAPLTSVAPDGYPDMVVYCAQAVGAASCATSLDGGFTFGPASPMYTAVTCGGLHGHARVAPNGFIYVPNPDCNGQQGLVVSTDGGATWTVHLIPGSSNHANSGDSDPWVDVGADGTVYFGYSDGDGHAKIVVSHDAGNTFTPAFDVGASQGIQNSEFPAVVVGDSNRAAFAFLGTQTAGDDQSSTFAGNWYLYVAFTYDGGSTWTTYNATPNDPVQRGCIWNQGGGNPCRNLLDFIGIARDAVGRVLVGYADGCIGACDTQNAYTYNALASIARQTGGIGLFAQYDGQIFKTAPGTPALSGLAGNGVNHLFWNTPNSGGEPITNFKIYRSTASNSETLYATVGAVNSFDDSAVSNGTTYYYRVAAVNAVGQSSTSNEVALTPAVMAAPSAPRKLKATSASGAIMLTWTKPASQGTAPVTGYRIYRGTVSGFEQLLLAVGNQNNYMDSAVTSGTKYYYKVTAINSVGEGPASNETSASPK